MGRTREACYRRDMTDLLILGLLAELGPLSLTQLAARIGATRDGVMSALGRFRDLGRVRSARQAGQYVWLRLARMA